MPGFYTYGLKCCMDGTIDLDSSTLKWLLVGSNTVYTYDSAHTSVDAGGANDIVDAESNISGGYGCPPMTVIIDDNNYKKIEVTIDAGGQKQIRLNKIIQVQNDTVDQEKVVKFIRQIFEEYKHNEEGIDSEENKTAMTNNLKSMKLIPNKKDFELLLNIWQYYDPTDYSCRPLVLNVLLQDKTKSIAAVKDRMKNKLSWETDNTEFKYLLKELEAK